MRLETLYHDFRNGEDNGTLELYNDGSLNHQLSFCSTDDNSYNVDEVMILSQHFLDLNTVE